MCKKHTYTKTMKSIILKGFVILLLFSFSNCSNDETQDVVNNFTTLVRVDEFNVDGVPDDLIWGFDIGTGDNGWGNGESQYYTDRPENVTVQNGVLVITAEEEDFNGSRFTSARMTSQNLIEQQFGRFEARMKLPFGQGIWPAFWLLGNNCDQEEFIWPRCGEIDIMEYRGQQPTIVHGTIHGPGYSGADGITKSFELENDRFDTDFHVFGIEWSPDFINFYVDDVLYNQIRREDVPGEWVFDHPFYIIINLAVEGSFVGDINDETIFPQTLLVDYVRVFE